MLERPEEALLIGKIRPVSLLPIANQVGILRSLHVFFDETDDLVVRVGLHSTLITILPKPNTASTIAIHHKCGKASSCAGKDARNGRPFGMRILFALPGLHRYDRGAEVAFISVARELAKAGLAVTLIGSGNERPGALYRFVHAPSMPRENFTAFPMMPILRSEYIYEELTFVPGLLSRYCPADYDITLTCSYPFTNWILRRPALGPRRPPHVFVTENGDWPAQTNRSEYRFFGCEGLICTNPDFYERNKNRWRSVLIPNGVDCERFKPGPPQRELFGIPNGRLVVLMVSALVPTKRVDVGVKAVSRIANAQLVVAGNGPLHPVIEATAARLLPGRFTQLMVNAEQMPALYQSADVFLHLSKEESFGNVFLEAMACGLPVVAHDSARVRWIVGDEQFLMDSENITVIADTIVSAGNSSPDQQQQRVARAATFSWSKVGAMYLDFFRDIVA